MSEGERPQKEDGGRLRRFKKHDSNPVAPPRGEGQCEGRHGIWYFNPFNFHGPPLSRMALCNLIEFSVKDVIILAV